MEVDVAIKAIDYEVGIEDVDMGNAHTVFFKKLFNVDVKNEDGTIKSVYDILKESNNNMKGST